MQQIRNHFSWQLISNMLSITCPTVLTPRDSCTGRVINVESQEMKFHEWGVGVDPDESCWVESVKFNVSFLVVIRVFFEAGESAYEEIGMCWHSIDDWNYIFVNNFSLYVEFSLDKSLWLFSPPPLSLSLSPPSLCPLSLCPLSLFVGLPSSWPCGSAMRCG